MQVQTEANQWDAENPYVTGVDELEFMPRLDDRTQYATVYAAERPVGTLQRRRYLERGPVWKLYATNGELIRVWHFRPSYRALAKATRLALVRASVIRSEVR